MRTQLSRGMISLLFALAMGALLWFASPPASGQDSKPWRVWQKDSPCSGRFDWVVVSQENPGGSGGLASYEIFPGSHQWPTAAQAQAEADADRFSPRFSQYCCRDYSVWQNQLTGKFTVVVGKYPGNPGPGWFFKKGDLCCEEAYVYAGLPNAETCGAGGSGGCGIGYQWNEEEAGFTSTWVRRGHSNIFDATYTAPGGQRAGTINTVTVEGNRVTIKRTASSDGNLCSYTGTITGDTVQGTYYCPIGGRTRPWKAKIICSAATPKAAGG